MIQDHAAQEPLSLAGLNDVVLPPEVSLWPSAPGWIAVGVALLVFLAVLARWLVLRRRALRYRRAALAELRELRAARLPEELPPLLKRVALAVYPRNEVATLSGALWTAFLDRTGGAGRFRADAGEQLQSLAYGGSRSLAPEELDQLYGAAEVWIRAQGPAWERLR